CPKQMSVPNFQRSFCTPRIGVLRRGVINALLGVLAVAWLMGSVAAQESSFLPSLARGYFRSGEETLQALAPLSAAPRNSIVKLDVDEETVALGTVVDTNGLVLTKASEIKPGKLTCWLASEKEVDAEVVGIDEDEDVALVHVHDKNLKPIIWS